MPTCARCYVRLVVGSWWKHHRAPCSHAPVIRVMFPACLTPRLSMAKFVHWWPAEGMCLIPLKSCEPAFKNQKISYHNPNSWLLWKKWKDLVMSGLHSHRAEISWSWNSSCHFRSSLLVWLHHSPLHSLFSQHEGRLSVAIYHITELYVYTLVSTKKEKTGQA